MHQTQWCTYLLLLATVYDIGISDDNVLYKVFEKVSEEKEGCDLPAGVRMNTQCRNLERASLRARLPARVVPPGVVCIFQQKDNFTYTCSQGGIWIQDEPNLLLSKTTHHRNKRWILAILAQGGKDFLKNLGLMKKLLCLFLCKKNPKPKVPSLSPPKLDCPKVKSPQHPIAGKTAKVTWATPFASDRLQGPLQAEITKGQPSGSEFPEGKHFVYYRVKNKIGLAAYCTISFVVEVSRCPRPVCPFNGQMKCDDEQLSGSVCTFSCNIGFKMVGENQIMCLNDKWVGNIPKCERKHCPAPPAIPNGYTDCPDNRTDYAATCAVKCNPGYLMSGTGMILCNSTGTWTHPGTCRDSKAPTFPSGCVEDVNVFAEAMNRPVTASWKSPKVTDNSGSDVTVTYSHTPGSKFPLGRTIVTVKATDKSKNVMKCSFTINVEEAKCRDPAMGNSINKDLLVYECPNGTALGFSCHVFCKANYPREGASEVTCSQDFKTGKLRWTWKAGEIKPFCKTTDCPKLRQPINGAITCDKWTHGRMCTMHCHKDYDVPRRVPDLYVCGMDTGRWRPHDTVQDCIVRRKPDKMRLPAEMYYYSAGCPDDAAKKEMSKNFIKILKNDPLFSSECGDRVKGCRPEMVDVKCGKVRNKREVKGQSSKKSIIVEFKVTFPYDDLGMNASDIAMLYKKFFSDLTGSIEKMVQKGSFELKGYEMNNSSFAPGLPGINCPKGTKPRFNTGSCAGCPTGTFYNETIDDCEGCAKGSYQDKAFSTSCELCPEGTTTNSNGSRTAANCTEMCPIGSFSSYGSVPCIYCPLGTYSDRRGQTLCTACPPGLTTLTPGADSYTACVAYDITLKGPKIAKLGEITNSGDTITVYTWLHIDDGVTEATVFQTRQYNQEVSVTLNDNKLTLIINGESSIVKEEIMSKKWFHVALTIDPTKKMANMYVSGKFVFSKTCSLQTGPNRLIITATSKQAGVTYSGLNVIRRQLNANEIEAISGTCKRTISESIFLPNMKAGQLVTPSNCDDFDDCATKPCGEHRCIDEVGKYTCECSNGFKGDNCDVAPDSCSHSACQNDAECTPNSVNYTCKCRPGFKGELCAESIVNGNWSPWGTWSLCSRMCGGGVRSRSRKCNNPPPEAHGKACKGNNTEKFSCNTQQCKVCEPLKRSYGVVTSCKTSDESTVCKIKCRDDLVFAEEPLPTYECGAKTDYNWNHQTDEHPDGRLPACTTVNAVKGFSMNRKITLPTLPCTPDGKADRAVTSQVASQSSDVACIKDKTCKPQIDVRKCQSGRGRRAAGTTVTMKITSTITHGASLDLGKLVNNNTMTHGMRKYLKTMLSFEQSAQEVVNNSATVFSVTVNGKKFAPDVNSATTDVDVTCKPGEMESNSACIKCPTGSREVKGACLLCRRGFYQDQTGATTCVRCAKGKTTLAEGSQTREDCTHLDYDEHFNSGEILGTTASSAVEDKPASDHTMVIVLSVLITAMVLSITAAAIIWIIKMKKVPAGSHSWGEAGRNKINPGPGEENAPPPYPAVYIPPPPPPPPYTPMDALNPGLPNIRPNTASDVQLRVFNGGNLHTNDIQTVPAATQTSLGPTPSTTPRSSRNPSPNRPSPNPSPSQSQSSSRSPSPGHDLSNNVNSKRSRSVSPVRMNDMYKTANLPAGSAIPNGTGSGLTGHQSRSPSPNQLRSPTRTPSPARSLADAVGVSRGAMITPPPAAVYSDPIQTPIRKLPLGDAMPRCRSPNPIISSS